jgi:hypothetical protein
MRDPETIPHPSRRAIVREIEYLNDGSAFRYAWPGDAIGLQSRDGGTGPWVWRFYAPGYDPGYCADVSDDIAGFGSYYAGGRDGDGVPDDAYVDVAWWREHGDTVSAYAVDGGDE